MSDFAFGNRVRTASVAAALALASASPAPGSALDNGFETGPGGTAITVSLTERLSSQDAVSGQRFGFETTAPVTVDGVYVPKGTPGDGSVIFARSGRGPEPGKMRLAAGALHLQGGKTIAVGLEPSEAGTVSAADSARAAGLAFPTSAGTLVIGGIARGNNVVYERGARFTLLAPPPPTPEPEPT